MKAFLAPLLACLSGFMFALPYLFPQLFITTWLAFIPLLYALEGRTAKQAYCLGLIFGLSCYATACYWIVDFLQIFKDYPAFQSSLIGTAFWFYSAQLTAFACLIYQWIQRHTQLSEMITFPIIMMSFYSYFPMLFSAQIGESQSQFLWAIQATDITGVAGLDILICLVNISLFQLARPSQPCANLHSRYFALFIVISWFTYGAVSLNYWQQQQLNWPLRKIGVVQPNEAPVLGEPQRMPGYSLAYPPEMAATEQLAQTNVELVVWPESRYNGFFDYPAVQNAFQHQIAQLGIPLLFQDLNNQEQTFNTTILLDSKGHKIGEYKKIKRVAFGEYLPLIEDLPWLNNLMKRHLGNFLDEVAKGDASVTFQLPNLQLVPLICYEVMFPAFVARAVPETTSNTLLVVQSSNGWFGNTRQPFQHIYAAALRSVENRLPMIHAINNGPSTVTGITGEISIIGGFHEAGSYLVELPIATTSHKTFYSRHPDLLRLGAPLLLTLMLLFNWLRSKKTPAVA